MEAVVEQTRKLLRRVARGKVRAAHVADEKRVPGEHREGLGGAVEVGHQDADALYRVARCFQYPQHAPAEPDLVAFADSHMRKRGAGPRAHVDLRARSRRQFVVPGNEVGVQVRFDHVSDAQAVLARFFDVKLDVTLRVHHRGHTVRTNHVRSVRQAAQIELFEIHAGPPLMSRV